MIHFTRFKSINVSISKLTNLKSLILIIFLSISGYSAATATDLIVSSIISPHGTININEPQTISFVVSNINVLPALNYFNMVVITKKDSTNPVYMTTVEGIPIQPGENKTHTATETWTPTEVGVYTMTVDVNYSQDIDHSNDTLREDIIVVPKDTTIFAKYPFTLSQANFAYPTTDNNSLSGMFTVTFPQLDNPVFVNVMARLNLTSSYVWLVQNFPLLPFAGISTISNWIDLGALKIHYGYSIDSLLVNVKWSDSVIYQPFEVQKDTNVMVNKQDIVIHVDNGIKDTLLNVPLTIPLINFDSLQIITWNYRGCNVPNIDLDSTNHNPGTTPGYAGDKNACGPAAAANSMQWLENDHPKVPLTPTTHRQKMEELSKLMNRANEDGVNTKQLVEGKLAFIDKYRLPIRVKFQSVWVGDSTIKSPNAAYGNGAKNDNAGNKTPPTWDWYKQEFNHGEDVEILIGWYDAAGTRHGGHWITGTGISEVKGAKGLYFKDDANQKDTGGTREQFVNWVEGANGWSRLTGLNNGYYPWIESVVSESYDSTVNQDADPMGYNLAKFIGIFFDLDSKKGEVQVAVTPDDKPRYINLWAGKTNTMDLFWYGRNILLPPFETTQYYTYFYDFSDLKFAKNETPDSIRTSIKVTDMPVTTADTIKNFVDVKLGLTKVDIGKGDVDTFKIIMPNVLPTLPGFEGWELKDYVFRGCNVPNIDLDSSKNNPGTIAGYAGDKNACGPAAASNSMEWLASINPKLDPKNTHRDKLKELSGMMQRANNAGVTTDNFIKAKLDFIDKYKLPIKVKFQSFKLGSNDIASPNAAYGHKAQNKNDSANKPPKWNFLVQEMKDSEDVEMEYGYYDSAGARHGGHWVTVNGVSDVSIAKGLYFKDDLNQADSGGTRNPYVNWKDTLGYSLLVQFSTGGYSCWVETIVSESYDSTVKFEVGGVNEQIFKDIYQLNIIPNPSPTGTNINIVFNLPESSTVEAEIYDLNGSLVTRLYNGRLEPGSHNILWNGKNANGEFVTAGAYIVSLNINGNKMSEKIIRN